MELILVHLTDIHIETEKDYETLCSRSEYIGKVINKHITDAENTTIAICITGDIACSGKEEQYLLATIFLNEVLEIIKKRYNDIFIQVISVPGNHDCDFDSNRNIIREPLLNSPDLDISNTEIIETCTSIQENYYNFVKEWEQEDKVKMLACNKESILTVNELNFKDISLKFHCFNTACCSKINEKPNDMKLQIPDIGDKLKDDIVITLMHHDESWLDWKSVEFWKQYYKNYSDIVFVGHDHVSEIVLKENYGEATNYFAKGNQLYSKEYVEQSGFNLLKINLKNNIERFYSYELKAGMYKNILDTKAKEFIRNRFIKTGVELKEDVLLFIDDIEMDIVSKYKGALTLTDVYAFPVLKGERLSNSKENRLYKNKDEILAFIQNKKYIMVSGEKEYGKTALIKQLYKVFFELKLYPVFISLEKVRTSDGEELNEIVGEFYNKQYNNLDKEIILQMEPNKKVCIIDDFEETMITDKSIKKIIKFLMGKFGIMIITSSLKNDMLGFLKNVETKEYLQDNFTRLSIQDLRGYGRRKLVNNWLLLSDSELDVESQEFDVIRRNKLTQVESVMKSGFFNKTPIEFLLVLSYLDNHEKMNADYSRYSYVYECLILDKINELSGHDANEATMYKTILEQLAYKMYENNAEQHVGESFILGVIFDYNQDYRGNKLGGIDVVTNLIKFKILEKKNNKYKFKHNYMIYFFVGSFIQNQIEPAIKMEKVQDVFSDLSKEINFNIALFLAFKMNFEYEILPQIKTIADDLLSAYNNFEYEQQRDLVKKLEFDISKKVDKIFNIPQNANIPALQEESVLAKDSRENEAEIKNIESEETVHNDEELEKLTKDYMKTLRIIEFLGDIIKNYSASVKKNPRIKTIDLMYRSTLKIIGALYSLLNEKLDDFIEIIDERAKEDNEKIEARSQYVLKIKQFISVYWTAIVELSIRNLGFSLQSDRIADDMCDYNNEMDCTFFKMVYINYMIRTQNGELPVKEIETCVKGKSKLDSFSQNVLKEDVALFLRNYQFNSKEKEAVCSLLNFKVNDMLIDEQKNKLMGLNAIS